MFLVAFFCFPGVPGMMAERSGDNEGCVYRSLVLGSPTQPQPHYTATATNVSGRKYTTRRINHMVFFFIQIQEPHTFTVGLMELGGGWAGFSLFFSTNRIPRQPSAQQPVGS